ncbi:ADP/ATP translocase 1-like [Folsomia candida]|uniref:ADP/ATP translocase 1-like n=1 Tax=Folsomia candida TaxID=158441 RepID=UPI000B8FB520|nr:ADP/ATP translocase 1-like [Folsomia candida]
MTTGPDSYVHFLAHFLAGGTSAALALTAIAPLERIKLLLQTQKGASHIPKEHEYKGIIDCLIRIPKEQGFLSFWRGNWAGILRVFPYQAMNFSFKELFKEKFIHKSDELWYRLGGNVLSGGVAGACALTVIYPLDYARTR